MAIAVSSIGNPIVKQLVEAGIVPPQCTKFELIFEVHRAVKVRTESFVTEEEFRRLADILAEHAGELAVADFAREFVFTEMVTKRKLEIK